jgi:hypothetical protein
MPSPPLSPISTAEQVSPAAPISWIEITAPLSISSRHASSRRFSVNGSPTCTVGRFSSSVSSNSADAMVAPPTPSRPVLAPR